MQSQFDAFVMGASTLIEILAVLVVGYGAVLAFYQLVTRLVIRRGAASEYDQIRIGLAKAIVLGLEFEIGADLLKIAISPTWHSIGVVAAIFVLRSLLNFVLEKDISRLEAELERASAEPAPAQS